MNKNNNHRKKKLPMYKENKKYIRTCWKIFEDGRCDSITPSFGKFGKPLAFVI